MFLIGKLFFCSIEFQTYKSATQECLIVAPLCGSLFPFSFPVGALLVRTPTGAKDDRLQFLICICFSFQHSLVYSLRFCARFLVADAELNFISQRREGAKKKFYFSIFTFIPTLLPTVPVFRLPVFSFHLL